MKSPTLTCSIILPHPLIPGVVSTGFIFAFIYMYTHFLHRIHPPIPSPHHFPPPSGALAIKEMQIKTTLRVHLTPVRIESRTQMTTNVGEGVGKKEPSYSGDGKVS
jgi:hypothetical protein